MASESATLDRMNYVSHFTARILELEEFIATRHNLGANRLSILRTLELNKYLFSLCVKKSWEDFKLSTRNLQ